MTPEAKARQLIDDKLAQAGWVVQDMKQLNLATSDRRGQHRKQAR
jgi:type I restriction enzyme, R subunit